MIYNAFQDMKLSALGMGNMRLPVMDGNDAAIDEAATAAILDYCMAHGINYYDTAWGYHSGNSELVVGKLLQKYPRESFYLASKFPGYDLSNMGKVEEIFEEQLRKCRVEYFDSVISRAPEFRGILQETTLSFPVCFPLPPECSYCQNQYITLFCPD